MLVSFLLIEYWIKSKEEVFLFCFVLFFKIRILKISGCGWLVILILLCGKAEPEVCNRERLSTSWEPRHREEWGPIISFKGMLRDDIVLLH